MRKVVVTAFVVCLAFVLGACGSVGTNEEQKYTMNATHSYGGDAETTTISYDIVITAEEEVIENIDAYEVLINMDYLNLMLVNGSHHAQKELEDTPYFQVTGDFAFNTRGKSKEEIDGMNLLQGITIIDKSGDEERLYFNN